MVTALAIVPGRGEVLVGTRRGRLHRLTLADLALLPGGEPRPTPGRPVGALGAIGARLAVISAGGELRWWDLERERAGPVLQVSASCRGLEPRPDGSRLAIDGGEVVTVLRFVGCSASGGRIARVARGPRVRGRRAQACLASSS
ncbi:MAG: hypothetical protein AB7N76_11110 [Planctomycetota bacterium]